MIRGSIAGSIILANPVAASSSVVRSIKHRLNVLKSIVDLFMFDVSVLELGGIFVDVYVDVEASWPTIVGGSWPCGGISGKSSPGSLDSFGWCLLSPAAPKARDGRHCNAPRLSVRPSVRPSRLVFAL